MMLYCLYHDVVLSLSIPII